MEIKRFNIPTFEEWQKHNMNVKIEFGAYRLEIREILYGAGKSMYRFACACANTDACNLYAERFFDSSYIYDGDMEELRQWYEKMVETFHGFWENHIKSTYIKSDED